MRMDKLEVGQTVVSVTFPDEVGEVVELDYENGVVWVKIEVANHPGVYDELDLDPDDIQLVEESS